jgi:hypothetical protein
MAKIQIKRGLQENVENLVLSEGEFAVALDTGNVYIGTTSGTTHVNPKGGIADSAAKLTTARAFSISGDAIASPVNFDGTAPVELVLALAVQPGLTAGTYSKVTVNNKGIITTASNLTIDDIPDLQGKYVPITRTVNGKALSDNITITAADVSAIPAASKGAANGVAELDSDGKVLSSQLPSYVDDVVEYENQAAFPETGESGKIYIAQDTNITYRWSGTAYVEISASIALGETSATAYRGDRGKTAYDHSQLTSGNPHGTTASDVGAVPTSRQINNKPLTGNITLGASDVGAAPSAHVDTIASATTLGHVKIGDGLSIMSGVVSVGNIDGGTF